MYKPVIRRIILFICVCSLCVRAEPPSTGPPSGLRYNTPAVHAIVHARIVVAPGNVLENATLVMRDGVITAVGADVAPPPDARIWNMSGKTIYAGLIDAYSELAPDASKN